MGKLLGHLDHFSIRWRFIRIFFKELHGVNRWKIGVLFNFFLESHLKCVVHVRRGSRFA